MAERNVSVRLAVVDVNRVKAELRAVGDEGARSLDRIARASAPASGALKAVDAAARSLRGGVENFAGRAGAAGAALSSLGPAGLVAAAGVAAVGLSIGKGLTEFAEAERAYLRLEAVLRATGYASGLTAGQISELGDAIEKATFATAEEVQEAAGILATFRSVSGDVFREAIVLAQDLSAVFGQSLSSSATQLGKALENPVEGISALRRVGVTFNATQRETIENFVRTGQTAEAQGLILDVLRQQVGGAGAAEGGGLAGAFDRAKDATGNFLEKLVEVTGIAPAVEAALNGIAASAEAMTERMGGVELSVRIVAVNKELLEAEDNLRSFEELARRTGMGVDEVQVETWRIQVDRLKAELDDLMARSQAEVDEIRQAEAGRAAAESDARTEAAITRLRDIRQEIESLATPEEKVAAIRDRLAETVTQIEALRNADGSNATPVDNAVGAAEELARRRIDAIEKPARDAAEREAARTKETIDELARSVQTFGDSRTQAIDGAIARLGEGATPEQRSEAARLAGALHDLGAAEKSAETAGRDLQKVQAEGRAVFEATRTESERYAAEIEKLNGLLEAGAIDQDTYARAAANAADVLRDVQTDPLSGAIRALDDYAKSAADMAAGIENAIANAFSGAENAVAEFVKTGKLDVSDLVTSIIADLARLAVRQTFLGPLAGALSSVLKGGLGSLFGNATASGVGNSTSVAAVTLHDGGTVGVDGTPTIVPVSLFADSSLSQKRGPILQSDEVPAILQTGERVLSRREVAQIEKERSQAAAAAFFLPDGETVKREGSLVEIPLSMFENARRYHDGGPVTPYPGTPAALRTGGRSTSRREAADRRNAPPVFGPQAAPVVVNIYAQDARSFMTSRTQIAAELSRMVEAGRRGR